jgi:hypothetical protein
VGSALCDLKAGTLRVIAVLSSRLQVPLLHDERMEESKTGKTPHAASIIQGGRAEYITNVMFVRHDSRRLSVGTRAPSFSVVC